MVKNPMLVYGYVQRARAPACSAPPLRTHNPRKALMSAMIWARIVCGHNPHSADCAVAWDTYDELLGASARKREASKEVDPLEEYCKSMPEDLECRMYDV